MCLDSFPVGLAWNRVSLVRWDLDLTPAESMVPVAPPHNSQGLAPLPCPSCIDASMWGPTWGTGLKGGGHSVCMTQKRLREAD